MMERDIRGGYGPNEQYHTLDTVNNHTSTRVSASLWRLRATPNVVVPHRRASTRQFAGQTTSAISRRVTRAARIVSMG